ncbi:MAG: hypothetical protein MI806_08110 [Minwuiales bacterium]|nr:hypothetical protein [Minwuiales bacterium]
MTSGRETAIAAATERLARCYGGGDCDWDLFYRPRRERANFASRYHLVYPALGYFIELKQRPDRAAEIRPLLDTIYRGLLTPRVWRYWHDELGETTWPLQERNLTYAGRLATFVGFYIDAFGEPPAATIELDGRATTYSALSESLWRQMTESPSCGVSCYHHQSMVMCNAHMLINNVLHDRLFGTGYAQANRAWLATVDEQLTTGDGEAATFFYGTEPNRAAADETKRSVGADIWTFFLTSAVKPDRARDWFEQWQRNVTYEADRAYVAISAEDHAMEFSSDPLATAWAFCLSKELGQTSRARLFANTLRRHVAAGFELDPLLSGLYLLGERLEAGAFRRLVAG